VNLEGYSHVHERLENSKIAMIQLLMSAQENKRKK
jgi:hypothetical protein